MLSSLLRWCQAPDRRRRGTASTSARGGYCDLFLGVSPLFPAARFAWLLELKYLSAGAKAAQIERAFAEAEAQVGRYASDERLVPLLTRGQALRAGSLVFVGAKRVLFRPWSVGPAKTPAAAARKAAGKARAMKGKRAGEGRQCAGLRNVTGDRRCFRGRWRWRCC